MTNITPELLAEIQEKAVYASGGEWHSSPQEGGKCRCNLAQVWDADGKSVAVIDSTEDPAVASSRAAHVARMDPPTVLALVEALEEAQRAVQGLIDEADFMRSSGNPTLRDLTTERDTLRAENERLREALESIRLGDTTTFDDETQAEVSVSMDADEMSAVADAALKETTHAD